jgi:type II secretory pathway component PulK
MRVSPNRRRAFVATFAILLIALVAVALLALANQFATAARQARTQREAAQAEQLLLAGMEIARQPHAAEKQTIKLPAALADDSATLTITRQAGQTTVEARVGKTTFREPPQP